MTNSSITGSPIGRIAFGRSVEFADWLARTFTQAEAFRVIQDPGVLLRLLREQPIELFLLEEEAAHGMIDYFLSLIRECNADALCVCVVPTHASAHADHSPFGACIIARDWPRDAVIAGLSDLSRLWATRRRVTRLAGRLDQLRQRDSRQHHNAINHARQLLHEIATPLALAQGGCKHLVDELRGAVTAEQQEALQRILQAIDTQSELVDHLRARLKQASSDTRDRLIAVRNSQRRQVRLDQICQDVIRLLRADAEQRKVKLDLRAAEARPVWGDRLRLSQLLTNLLTNALRYTPPGGTIAIDAQTIERDERGRTGARLVVRDSGPGIPVADRDRVFERGFTTEDPNVHSGMGLAICTEVVLEHNGAIRVGGEPGAGAVFEVVLPMDPRQRGTRPVRIVHLRDQSALDGLRAALRDDGADEPVELEADAPTVAEWSGALKQANTIVLVEPPGKPERA